MFKTKANTAKSEATRARILSAALRLLRKRGFDAATMRDIALETGMSLGAAYYYFPTKEAIVVSYYDQVQDEHERRTRESLSGVRGVGPRIRAALHAKLDVIGRDRSLLSALFRRVGDPRDPLGVFSPGTKPQRDQSIATFAAAIGNERMPEDLRAVAPTILWFIHLGLIFFMLYDDSPDQLRTRKLADAAADLFTGLLSLANLPGLGSLRKRTLAALHAAEVL